MQLNELASNPNAPINNLPYPNPDHLRDFLTALNETKGKLTKIVLRYFRDDINYRTIKNGLFIGEKSLFLFYPFPSIDQLESTHYSW
jgi:hypothetical protein